VYIMISVSSDMAAFHSVELEYRLTAHPTQVISEAVFTANHLTDTDIQINKQNGTRKYTN